LIAFSAVILGVHFALMQQQPNIMTIIVPRHLQQGREIGRVSFLSYSLWKHVLLVSTAISHRKNLQSRQSDTVKETT